MSAVTANPAILAGELEPFRRELIGYCYRMLGSVHEAEDAVQDTMLRAWKALETFEDRAGLRPWLTAVDALADHKLTPLSANGSPAAAVYRPEAPGTDPTAFAIHVLDVVAGRIGAVHSFIDPTLFEVFGLTNLPDFQAGLSATGGSGCSASPKVTW